MWDWHTDEIWGRISRNRLPVNPVYAKLQRLGAPSTSCWVSAMIDEQTRGPDHGFGGWPTCSRNSRPFTHDYAVRLSKEEPVMEPYEEIIADAVGDVLEAAGRARASTERSTQASSSPSRPGAVSSVTPDPLTGCITVNGQLSYYAVCLSTTRSWKPQITFRARRTGHWSRSIRGTTLARRPADWTDHITGLSCLWMLHAKANPPMPTKPRKRLSGGERFTVVSARSAELRHLPVPESFCLNKYR